MIAYDMDVDVTRRRNQPLMYGYLPEDNELRGRCFVLMTLTSALHNLSRSVGVAMLATNGRMVAFYSAGGEVLAFFIFKGLRRDYYWFPKLTKGLSLSSSTIHLFSIKIITDFSGCLHLRHPYECGGLVFSVSMLWAQIFPFVALQLFDGENKSTITLFLAASFALWLVLTIAFFCTINTRYVTRAKPSEEQSLSRRIKKKNVETVGSLTSLFVNVGTSTPSSAPRRLLSTHASTF